MAFLLGFLLFVLFFGSVSLMDSGMDCVVRKYNIAFVVLFGSFALGTPRKDSDVDVAILSRDRRPLLQSFEVYSEILGCLEDFIKPGFRTIDLIDLARASILLRYEATRRGVLLFGDRDAYTEYKIFAFKDYTDSRSLRELEAKIIIRKQRQLASIL